MTARVSRATASVSGARRASPMDAAERQDRLAIIVACRRAPHSSRTSGSEMASSGLGLPHRARPRLAATDAPAALDGRGSFSHVVPCCMPVHVGQVRFITRPKSRTMRAKRNKRSRANRTNVPK